MAGKCWQREERWKSQQQSDRSKLILKGKDSELKLLIIFIIIFFDYRIQAKYKL